MASGDDGARQVTGTVPVGLAGLMATITSPTFNLTVAPTIPEGSDPQLGDPEDEKDCQGTFPLIMEGFQTATRTLSDGYQDACKRGAENCLEVSAEIHRRGLYLHMGVFRCRSSVG